MTDKKTCSREKWWIMIDNSTEFLLKSVVFAIIFEAKRAKNGAEEFSRFFVELLAGKEYRKLEYILSEKRLYTGIENFGLGRIETDPEDYREHILVYLGSYLAQSYLALKHLRQAPTPLKNKILDWIIGMAQLSITGEISCAEFILSSIKKGYLDLIEYIVDHPETTIDDGMILTPLAEHLANDAYALEKFERMPEYMQEKLLKLMALLASGLNKRAQQGYSLLLGSMLKKDKIQLFRKSLQYMASIRDARYDSDINVWGLAQFGAYLFKDTNAFAAFSRLPEKDKTQVIEYLKEIRKVAKEIANKTFIQAFQDLLEEKVREKNKEKFDELFAFYKKLFDNEHDETLRKTYSKLASLFQNEQFEKINKQIEL